MPFPDIIPSLRPLMPGLRGALDANAPMAPLSWFRTGGSAQVLFTPVDEEDLALFMAGLPTQTPWMVVGLGSNLLVRDGGVEGVVIRLGKGFGGIAVDGLAITAGAGAPDVKVARAAAEAGIRGLSFLRGIPGAIGGALRMNGGAYGGETKDVFVSARAVRRDGSIALYDAPAMGFSYRRCSVPADVVFTQATFRGEPGDREAILAEMQKITETRSSSQPVNTRTGGSTFKNPPGHSAWKLVDEAGCRGLTIGGAQVSPMHTNFLVNLGTASSADIETLGETVRERVKDRSGIELDWEIKRVGLPA
ncbi:UDP-N-acetylmuramate dehydrogenase [Labrys sp. KB_33_2]|uniref:UDP-N-acetylmuramate dehydrogenase n=1 Tax=unclassified Labrys (in: a-proteobacteria) TaxID=2688601 RepID=UPI003EBD50E7